MIEFDNYNYRNWIANIIRMILIVEFRWISFIQIEKRKRFYNFVFENVINKLDCK